MNADVLAEWMRRQGHSVIRTSSSYWVNAGPRVYQAFPYHCVICPSKEEINNFLVKNQVIAVRYSTPFETNSGSPSYHVVYSQNEYDYRNLSKKARHDVKKGLSISTIEPISLQRLAHEGWNLRLQTITRQGRRNAESEKWWRDLCLAADNLKGFEAWGAIVNEKLAASLLAFWCNDTFSIFYQQSLTEYLPFAINNALTYAVTTEALQRHGSPKLFYGLHSLDAPTSVDEFKFRMGYRAKHVRQKVEFHPLIRPFINRASHMLLQRFQRLFPAYPTLSKLEGMFRFYLNGNSLSSQLTTPHLPPSSYQ